MLVVGCSSSDSSTAVPQAQDPSNTGTTPIATPTLSPNGVPDLSRSASIYEAANVDYSKIYDVLEIQAFPPVVGNPQIEMTGIVSQSSGLVDASTSLLIGIEDNYGWRGTLWNNAYTIANASTYKNSQLNIYFSDSDTAVWLAGNVDSTGAWNGTILYRVRQASETTQCTNATCTPASSAFCVNWLQQQRDACIDYLNPNAHSAVKTAGYFVKQGVFSTSGSSSSWLTVQ